MKEKKAEGGERERRMQMLSTLKCWRDYAQPHKCFSKGLLKDS